MENWCEGVALDKLQVRLLQSSARDGDVIRSGFCGVVFLIPTLEPKYLIIY